MKDKKWTAEISKSDVSSWMIRRQMFVFALHRQPFVFFRLGQSSRSEDLSITSPAQKASGSWFFMKKTRGCRPRNTISIPQEENRICCCARQHGQRTSRRQNHDTKENIAWNKNEIKVQGAGHSSKDMVIYLTGWCGDKAVCKERRCLRCSAGRCKEALWPRGLTSGPKMLSTGQHFIRTMQTGNIAYLTTIGPIWAA